MYTRGIWIIRIRNGTKVHDVLWLGRDYEMKPSFFIKDEDDEYVYGIGYGEGGPGGPRFINKSKITLSLIYPALLCHYGGSIMLSPII